MSSGGSWLSQATPWVVPLRAHASARIALLCVPHAGAGASAFAPWSRAMPGRVALIGVQLPGREARFRERPSARMPEVVTSLATALAPGVEQPYALFGHSFGAVVAFELARELAGRRLPPPACVFVSGRAAPHVPQHAPPMHALADPDLMREVARRHGNIPAVILGDPELWGIFLTPLRADLSALETYEPAPAPAIGCPIVVLGGRDDPQTHLGPLEEWGRYSVRGAVVHTFPGGHFFLQTDAEAVQQRIVAELDRICDEDANQT